MTRRKETTKAVATNEHNYREESDETNAMDPVNFGAMASSDDSCEEECGSHSDVSTLVPGGFVTGTDQTRRLGSPVEKRLDEIDEYVCAMRVNGNELFAVEREQRSGVVVGMIADIVAQENVQCSAAAKLRHIKTLLDKLEEARFVDLIGDVATDIRL